jgi:ribosome biogenesis GTPase A
MAIQWFPGHMHTTRLALVERLKSGIDVVIELLDARLPGASANPLLATLTTGKPALKVLNKQDLADPERTALWLAHYNAQPQTRAIALDASEAAPAARLVQACRALAPLRGGMVKPLRVLVCGIPNVGKSTLINTLVRRKAAKTGDEAGITKAEQAIVLASDVTLFDTPGMLWPRIAVAQSGYHLAASGAIGRNAYDEQEVALALLERLQAAYAGAVAARYRLAGLAEPATLAALPAHELLALIARQRGLVQTGGRLDLQKAAEAVLNDFRSGALGRITLETPDEHARWLAASTAQEAERAAKAAERRARPRPARADKG